MLVQKEPPSQHTYCHLWILLCSICR